MRIINSLDELDLIIKELDDAAKISDDALRALFKTFRFEDSKQVKRICTWVLQNCRTHCHGKLHFGKSSR